MIKQNEIKVLLMDNVHGGNVHHIYLEESTGQLQKKNKKKNN